MELRPYQLEAIEAARQRFQQGAKRVLITAPTGAGKTVMFADIVARAVGKGSRALILAHRRELVSQASEKLLAAGVSHGIIQAGFRAAPHRPVQVASVQTLVRRPTAMSLADLVVVDECHHVTDSNTYSKILTWFPAARIVGVTATPWRLDGRGLADVFDAHVLARTPRQLRDDGYLVPVGGWEYEGIDTSTARVQRGDFVAGDMAAAATSGRVVGDIISEWLAHAAGKRTVLFAVTVEQSQLMVAEFRKAGVPAEHLDGETPTEQREAILRRLRSGETLLVSNCNVLTEGFDCPELEVCILARPTLSTALFLQMVGRVLRISPGKELARIHDHAGCLAAHGHPYAERDYSPTTSARVSRDEAKKSRAKKRCPACKSICSGYPCDACGHSPDPKELQLEYDAAAAKREITGDGVAPKRKVESDAERREKWKRRFKTDESGTSRHWFFLKMVGRHGPAKGARVYRWVSGFSESPRPEWFQEVEASA